MTAIARIAQLEELAKAGRWEWDVKQDALHWSPELSRIYGLQPGEAPEGYQGFLARVHPEDLEETRQTVERAFRERRGLEYQHRIVHADGQVRVLRSFVNVDVDERGEVVRLSGTCQDVTEKIGLRERLRQLQALASTGSIAAGLSHDLNNMVGALVLMCGSLRRRIGNSNEPLIEQIADLASRASTLTCRMRHLARASRTPAPCVPVARELERIGGLLRSSLREGFRLDLVTPASAGHVVIDPLDLERVVWNLVINARDAQPCGGVIEITADRATVVGHGPTREYCRITVRDEGDGMDEATAARLFEPFFTTKGTGTGLGLAVVHDIVDAAGGFVTVETRVGAGTRIRVHLPAID